MLSILNIIRFSLTHFAWDSIQPVATNLSQQLWWHTLVLGNHHSQVHFTYHLGERRNNKIPNLTVRVRYSRTPTIVTRISIGKWLNIIIDNSDEWSQFIGRTLEIFYSTYDLEPVQRQSDPYSDNFSARQLWTKYYLGQGFRSLFLEVSCT